jgi:hypothetical protein
VRSVVANHLPKSGVASGANTDQSRTLACLIVAFGKCVRSKFRFLANTSVRKGEEQFPDQNEHFALSAKTMKISLFPGVTYPPLAKHSICRLRIKFPAPLGPHPSLPNAQNLSIHRGAYLGRMLQKRLRKLSIVLILQHWWALSAGAPALLSARIDLVDVELSPSGAAGWVLRLAG